MKSIALMSSASLAVLALAAPALAQDDTSSADAEVITVTGFRTTLANARDIRRESDEVRDTIIAEDIAKFPDLNLAESLQRVSGVAINREAGEGRRVSLRGLGPDFTRVQLNGMEVLGNVDSPMDSRGQRTRDRAFDFNIFASELFNRVDVTKSFSADQNEGGLAGTVGLFTAKPFDSDGFRAAVSAQAGTNTATEDFSPRLAGLISQNWDDQFGMLFSVAYSRRDTQEQGYNTYRWRARDSRGSDLSLLPQADQDAVNSGNLIFPRGNRLSVWESEQERLGLTFAAQWRPAENVTLTFDALYGEFTGERDELHLAARNSSSTWLGGTNTHNGVTHGPATINEIRYNDANEVVYLDVSETNIATETRRQLAENDFTQFVLSGEWNVTERLTVSGLIGTEESNFSLPISDKFYLETYGGVISDYTGDRHYAYNTYDFDPADASEWWAHEIDLDDSEQTSSFDNAKFDLSYDLNDVFELEAGASWKKFENSGSERRISNLLRSEWQAGTISGDVSSVAQVFSGHDDQSWTIVDMDAAFSLFGVDREASMSANADIRNVYAVEEETVAAYAKVNWYTMLGDMPFRGNVGVRYFETETTAFGQVNGQDTTQTNSYDDVLPSINAVLEVTEDLQLRAAFSQNINRPSLGALRLNGSVSNVDNVGGVEIEVSASNPELQPYTSDNFDLGVEYFFGDVGMIGAGLFFKEIDGFVGTESISGIAYSQTGLSLDLLQAVMPTGQTASLDQVVSNYSRSVNLSSTDITGLELIAQSDFFFLPGLLQNAGFTANYTYVDAELDYADVVASNFPGTTTVFPLEGLSEDTFNFTLYYETDTYGARVSANYRSDYIARVGGGGSDEDIRGFNETTYVDASAFYQINDSIKWTLDLINLTDEREEQYSDSARRLYNTTTSGTTVYTGANVQF